MTIKELRRVGSRLKKAREEKHMNQVQLAELVHLTDSYIGMIERGERTPSLETFLNIINVLDVTADYILCDTVSYGYRTYLGEFEEQIDKLSGKDKEKLIKIMAAFLE